MAVNQALKCITLTAGDTITQYKAVYFDGADLKTAEDSEDAPLGIAQNAASSGEAVQVAIAGTSKMVASGAVAKGALVSADGASATEATDFSGNTATLARCIGRAVTAADDLDVFEVLIAPQTVITATA